MNAQTLQQLLAPLFTPLLLAMVLVSQLVVIGLNWAASKLLGANEPTLRNAVKCWGLNLLCGLLLALGIGGLTALLASLGISPGLLLLLAIPLGAGVVVGVPMSVYDFGVWRSLGFLLLLMVGNLGLSAAAGLVAPRTLDPRTLQALQAAALTAAHQARPGTVQPRAVPAGARAATLTQNVWLPVMLDGQKSGEVEVERGTQLEVVGEDGDQVQVKFLDAVVKVPRRKLSL